jgi:hypothetical protein
LHDQVFWPFHIELDERYRCNRGNDSVKRVLLTMICAKTGSRGISRRRRSPL